MRRHQNVQNDPLGRGQMIGRFADQNQTSAGNDFQIIDIDNDENIDLGGQGNMPWRNQNNNQIAASKKLEAARMARKNQKALISSSIEQVDIGRDEQVLDISPTQNDFRKLHKGGTYKSNKNEFNEEYREEPAKGQITSTFQSLKLQNQNDSDPPQKLPATYKEPRWTNLQSPSFKQGGQKVISFRNYASEISSGQKSPQSAAKVQKLMSQNLNDNGRAGPVKIINNFPPEPQSANNIYRKQFTQPMASSQAYGNQINQNLGSSRQSKSQIRSFFGKQSNDIPRNDQQNRAKYRGTSNQPGPYENQLTKGIKNFGGAFMSLFKAQEDNANENNNQPASRGMSRGRQNYDYSEQLNRHDTEEIEQYHDPSPKQMMSVKQRISSLVRGPNQGHAERKLGSHKKTYKKVKLDCTEDEVEYNWLQFKAELDEIYKNESKSKYAAQQPYDLIDMYLKPKIDNIKQILLDEDMQSGSIGECMEYTIKNNIFMEMVALAQSDHPQGMFTICLDFIIVLAKKIKNMPLIHNDKVHRSLLQMAKCIHGYIKNDIIEINDGEEKSMYVRTILDFIEMITDLVVDRDPEISKFFIEEQIQYQRTYGTQTYLPIQIILEFLKKESINQGNTYRRLLRNSLVNQLKINNQKVRRFILLESDFSINVTSKLSMYLQIMPEEIQLIRNNFEQFPDDETQIFQSGMNLKRQIHQNYSKNIMDCYNALNDYIVVIDKICDQSATSKVEYQRSKGDKKIVFEEQFCSTFFQQIMTEYFQPKLLNERNLDNVVALRTTYQILLQILKQIKNKQLALQIFYFIFGKRMIIGQFDRDDDSQTDEMFNNLRDEPSSADEFNKHREPNLNPSNQILSESNDPKGDALGNKSKQISVDSVEDTQASVKAPSSQMRDMSLQFSKLNFQAKNKLSSNAIDFPYQQQHDQQQEDVVQIVQDRNEQIMEIFNQLPLDDDEFNFVMNSSRSRMGPSDNPLDSSRFLETNMTMLDLQLDEMDNVYNNKNQQKIMNNFWNYINLNNTNKSDSFLEKSFTKQMLQPSFDLKKCRIEKMPAVCMKILNTFLKYNIAEINEQLLLKNFPTSKAQGAGNNSSRRGDNSSRNQLSLGSERASVGAQISEAKYYQILKAQSAKLKAKGNFRHIQKLLTDLRDTLANQSNNGESHLFTQMRDDKLDAIMIQSKKTSTKPDERAGRNTVRIGEYLDAIDFRKSLGNNISKGAALYHELTMSEIVEELQSNGRQSQLYFLFKYNESILKDSDSLNLEKRHRYSIMLSKQQSSQSDNFGRDSIDFDQEQNMQFNEEHSFNSSSRASSQIDKCFAFDKELYNMTSERYSLAYPMSMQSRDANDDDNCDIGSNSSDSDQNENLKINKSLNNTYRAGLINNQDAKRKKSVSKGKKGVNIRKSSVNTTNFDYDSQQMNQSSFGSKHLHLEDLNTEFMLTTLNKLDHYFDNQIDENVQLLQIVERVLNYDLDANFNNYQTRNQIYYVKKEVLLRVMNIIQKCETEFLGRVSLLNQSLQKQQNRPAYVGRNALTNQPEIFRYVIECLIVQVQRLSLFNMAKRQTHRRVGTFYSNMDFLDIEVLENIIPLYDQAKQDFTNVQAAIQACKDLFINKKKQMNSISLLLSWSFGDIIFEDSEINKVKRVSQFGFNRSVGLSAMIDAQLLAHQMQSAYEELMRQDQEFEATMDFYQMM